MLVNLATLWDSPLCAQHNDTKMTQFGSDLGTKLNIFIRHFI